MTVKEEYLTTLELSKRIKMTPGTIRNLIYNKKLIKNIHYTKPTSRKILFVWSKMEIWIYGENPESAATESKSLINI
jgi:hypothetical protein